MTPIFFLYNINSSIPINRSDVSSTVALLTLFTFDLQQFQSTNTEVTKNNNKIKMGRSLKITKIKNYKNARS